MIFKKFNLKTMISLRLICPRWKGVIEAICNSKEFLMLSSDFYADERLRKSKILSLDSDIARLYPAKRNIFIIRPGQFSALLCDFLAKLFPNLKYLAFFKNLLDQASGPSLEMSYVLQRWLNLYGLILFSDNATKKHFDQTVVQAIRQQTSLRYLTLSTVNVEKPIPAEFASQLDHLILASSEYYSGFFSCLTKLKPDCKVQIMIEEDCESADIFDKLIKLNASQPNDPIAHKVTHLYFDSPVCEDYLAFIFKNFVNLTFLELSTWTIVSWDLMRGKKGPLNLLSNNLFFLSYTAIAYFFDYDFSLWPIAKTN